MIVNAIDAYEAKRWPEGKEPGGQRLIIGQPIVFRL
jgi:hypothetical protein